MANTLVAAKILSGNYMFPPSTDEATISVLEVAAEVYTKTRVPLISYSNTRTLSIGKQQERK